MAENKKFPKAASCAQKAHKQSLQRKQRNNVIKRKIKESMRAVFDAVSAGNKEKAVEALRIAQPIIHKSVTKKIMHRNTAARRISRLARNVNMLSA